MKFSAPSQVGSGNSRLNNLNSLLSMGRGSGVSGKANKVNPALFEERFRRLIVYDTEESRRRFSLGEVDHALSTKDCIASALWETSDVIFSDKVVLREVIECSVLGADSGGDLEIGEAGSDVDFTQDGRGKFLAIMNTVRSAVMLLMKYQGLRNELVARCLLGKSLDAAEAPRRVFLLWLTVVFASSVEVGEGRGVLVCNGNFVNRFTEWDARSLSDFVSRKYRKKLSGELQFGLLDELISKCKIDVNNFDFKVFIRDSFGDSVLEFCNNVCRIAPKISATLCDQGCFLRNISEYVFCAHANHRSGDGLGSRGSCSSKNEGVVEELGSRNSGDGGSDLLSPSDLSPGSGAGELMSGLEEELRKKFTTLESRNYESFSLGSGGDELAIDGDYLGGGDEVANLKYNDLLNFSRIDCGGIDLNYSDYKVFTTKFDVEQAVYKILKPDVLANHRGSLAQSVANHRKEIDGRLVRSLSLTLRTNTKTYKVQDCQDGKIDYSKLKSLIIRPNEALIYYQNTAMPNMDTAVLILVDNSGSMKGNLIQLAATTCYLLCEILEKLHVKTEVLGFTTKNWQGGESKKMYYEWYKQNLGSAFQDHQPGRLNDLLHIVYKSFSDPWRSASRNIGGMTEDSLLKENIDGEALAWAARRISCRKEKRKIITVIADGIPVDETTIAHNGGESYLSDHLRHIISKTERSVKILSVGIGHDVGKFYKNHLNFSSKEKTIINKVIEKLTEVIRSRS